MAGDLLVMTSVRKPVRIVNIALTRAVRDDMLLRHPTYQNTKQMLESWITGTV
jgi:hypothetical protein